MVEISSPLLRRATMPCPNCQGELSITMDKLFSGEPTWCSTCGARLSVDLEQSQEALEALREVQAMVRERLDREGAS